MENFIDRLSLRNYFMIYKIQFSKSIMVKQFFIHHDQNSIH